MTAASSSSLAAASASALAHNLHLHSLLRDLHALSLERMQAAAVSQSLSAQVSALEANLSDSVRMQAAMQAKIQVLEYGLRIERRHNARLMLNGAHTGATGASTSSNSGINGAPLSIPEDGNNYGTLLVANGIHAIDESSSSSSAAAGPAGSSPSGRRHRQQASYHTLPTSFPSPAPGEMDPKIDPAMFAAYMAAIGGSPRGAVNDSGLPGSLPAPPHAITGKHKSTKSTADATALAAASASTAVDNPLDGIDPADLNYQYDAATSGRSLDRAPSATKSSSSEKTKPPSLSANTFMPPSEDEIEQEINLAKSPPAAAHHSLGSHTSSGSNSSLNFSYSSDGGLTHNKESGRNSSSDFSVSDKAELAAALAASPSKTPDLEYTYGSPPPADATVTVPASDNASLNQTAIDMSKPAAAAAAPVVAHARAPSTSASSAASTGAGTGSANAFAALTGTTGASKQWRPKLQLKSHLDAVRSVCFDRNSAPPSNTTGSGPAPTLLLSGSEDGTVQLWNLAVALTTASTAAMRKAGGAPQPLPLHTYRTHKGMVTAVHLNSAVGAFSAGVDGLVVQWSLPEGAASGGAVDLYGSYGTHSVFARRKLAHDDAVWSLDVFPGAANGDDAEQSHPPLLATAVANGEICVWAVDAAPAGAQFDMQSEQSPLHRLRLPGAADGVVPTSVQFVPSSQGRTLAAGYSNGVVAVWDISSGSLIAQCTEDETETPVAGSDAAVTSSPSRITQLVCHPVQDLLITSHVDHSVRFWDMTARRRVFLLPAHRNVVSCICVDGGGATLVTGSHDESIRIWSTDERKIKQVLDTHQTHRLKYQEVRQQQAAAGACNKHSTVAQIASPARKHVRCVGPLSHASSPCLCSFSLCGFFQSIHSVAAHPTQSYLASAGGDGIIKLYV